ncbi:MAG: oxidoreductase [Nocardioides sp.]|uniref:oxidoreductase n=1 Tax=Nocardioides sp. TaxID=35761 RepID=UPI0039E5C744
MTAALPARVTPTTPLDALPVRRDAAVRALAAAALGAGLLFVASMWVADGGLVDLGGSGLTSLGRLTGLGAEMLLLAQVLLLVRIPLLEDAYGRDRLVVAQRIVGLASVDLMSAHLVLAAWGHAAGRSLTSPAVLLALVATLALVVVLIAGIWAARHRLHRGSWRLLPLYAGLGLGLAIPYQLWTGQGPLDRGWARAAWWGLWAACLAAVLCWRLALPLWRSAYHRVRVAAVVPEGDGVVSVYLTGRRLDRLAHAGQFLVWRLLGRPGRSGGTPYSLSAAPTESSMRITVGVSGPRGASLAALRPGSKVLVEGGYGRLSHRPRTRPKVAFIGAGVGLAPLRALAEQMPYAPGEAVMVERYGDRPLFADELDRLGDARGLRVVRIGGARRAADSWVGSGYDTYDDVQVLRGWIPDIAERDVYVCGPPGWTRSVRRAALAAGLPADRFHDETVSH